jgi:SAM-dependent methyltransferase
MSRLTSRQDAFGHAMYDFYRGLGGVEIVERDDGLVVPSGGPAMYLAPYTEWPQHQKEAIALARGKVLDIGCGAGRVGLHLQSLGLDALGIDVSPLAIKVCKLRGLRKARVLPITEATGRLGTFDTLVMYGNNFGLLGGFRRARWLLRRFYGITGDQALIIAESRDPYPTSAPHHLAYHRLNRRLGRMGGQLRIRVRYLTYATPWFDYLLASKEEVRAILSGTGWKVSRFFNAADGVYIAVIAKAQ